MTEIASGITQDDLTLLRRPFTTAAVKFRPQAKKPSQSGSVMCLTYMDSRLVAERLSDVDPCWEFSYAFEADSAGNLGASMFFPVRGMLTVKGVTRVDIGQLDSSHIDDKYAKSAVSDALKRAAVLFGVGAYLYALGNAFVDRGGYWLRNDGRVGGLNDAGIRQIREWYATRISSPEFLNRFGLPIDYGDVIDHVPAADQDPEPETTVAAAATVAVAGNQGQSEASISHDDIVTAAIGELAVASGGNRNAAVRWAKSIKDKDRGLSKTVARAKESGMSRDGVAQILGDPLSQFIDAFDAHEVEDGGQ